MLRRIKETAPQLLCFSTVIIMEIEFGLQLKLERAKHLEQILSRLVESVSVLPFTREDAVTAAAIRATLQNKGMPIGAYDLLLAGCAISRGLVLVTLNTTEFNRISGLLLEDWRE